MLVPLERSLHPTSTGCSNQVFQLHFSQQCISHSLILSSPDKFKSKHIQPSIVYFYWLGALTKYNVYPNAKRVLRIEAQTNRTRNALIANMAYRDNAWAFLPIFPFSSSFYSIKFLENKRIQFRILFETYTPCTHVKLKVNESFLPDLQISFCSCQQICVNQSVARISSVQSSIWLINTRTGDLEPTKDCTHAEGDPPLVGSSHGVFSGNLDWFRTICSELFLIPLFYLLAWFASFCLKWQFLCMYALYDDFRWYRQSSGLAYDRNLMFLM